MSEKASDETVLSPEILTVGRLVPHKGHATVMKSLPALLKKWPRLIWTLVGQGPEAENLQRLAEDLGVTDSIRFRSNLTDEELHDCYRSADVFVQPNGEVDGAFEGYGMVFLEAGAVGLPVIGGNHGGVPEAVLHGKTGFLVEPFCPTDLTKALTTLLDNRELRKRMGNSGRRLAATRTWADTLAAAVRIDSYLAVQGGAIQ